MENNNQMLQDILEIVTFLKNNAVTKEEFSRHEEKQTEEFRKVRDEIISHVDGFVGLHKHLEIELTAIANKTNRLENYIRTIAKHLQLQLEKTN